MASHSEVINLTIVDMTDEEASDANKYEVSFWT